MAIASAGAQLCKRIAAWPRSLFAVATGALAIIVCAWFFPPRLEVWAKRDSRLQEWSRADAFMRQCEAPLRRDVEPALRWRLLPPLACRAMGLKGYQPLLVCWLGLAALAVFLAARLDQLTGRRSWAAIGTLGFATSGAFITALGWLGLNDGWYMLALLETSVGESNWGLAAWAFAAPWIDERYLLGLPLAIYARARLRNLDAGHLRRACVAALGGIFPYVLIRSGFSLGRAEAVSGAYVASMLDVFRFYAAYVPLGWAMGFRVAWVAPAVALADRGVGWGSRLAGFALGAVPLGVLSVLAWDLDRSTGILLPAYVLGIVTAARCGAGRDPAWRRRLLILGLACLLINLVLPYAHIVGPTVSWNRGPLGIWTALANR